METVKGRELVVVGVVLGLVCASVVWWLERFELAKIREEIRDGIASEAETYLSRYDEFRRWLHEHGRAD